MTSTVTMMMTMPWTWMRMIPTWKAVQVQRRVIIFFLTDFSRANTSARIVVFEFSDGGVNAINGSHLDEDQEEDEEEENDDDESDDDDANDLDENLIKAVDEALGSAKIQNSEESDLDDDQMAKFDNALAAAFKMRKKNKQHEIDLIQYKFKVLDLLQDLYKSTQRLDLIVVCAVLLVDYFLALELSIIFCSSISSIQCNPC
jgi:hypothetical protein